MTRKVTALIDADTILYQVTAAVSQDMDFGDGMISETMDLKEAISSFDSEIQCLLLETEATDYILCLSDPKANFRKDVLPTYKKNRVGKKRPTGFNHLLRYVSSHYPCRVHPRLEGDDVMGMLATGKSIKGKRIIVSIDKDMKTIPGTLYNPNHQTMVDISLEEADHYHLMQTLTGDRTDGYDGCPGVGPVKAMKILDLEPNQEIDNAVWRRTAHQEVLWDAVVAAYDSKGLTEKDALVQARVAHILRYGDYNIQTNEVKLWEPSR